MLSLAKESRRSYSRERESKGEEDSRNESLDGTLRGGSGDIDGEVDRRVGSSLSREEVLNESREDVGCGSGGVPEEKGRGTRRRDGEERSAWNFVCERREACSRASI